MGGCFSRIRNASVPRTSSTSAPEKCVDFACGPALADIAMASASGGGDRNMKKRPATHSAAPWLTEADLPEIPPKDMEPSAKAAIMKERRRIQERLREQKRTLSRPSRSGVKQQRPPTQEDSARRADQRQYEEVRRMLDARRRIPLPSVDTKSFESLLSLTQQIACEARSDHRSESLRRAWELVLKMPVPSDAQFTFFPPGDSGESAVGFGAMNRAGMIAGRGVVLTKRFSGFQLHDGTGLIVPKRGDRWDFGEVGESLRHFTGFGFAFECTGGLQVISGTIRGEWRVNIMSLHGEPDAIGNPEPSVITDEGNSISIEYVRAGQGNQDIMNPDFVCFKQEATTWLTTTVTKPSDLVRCDEEIKDSYEKWQAWFRGLESGSS